MAMLTFLVCLLPIMASMSEQTFIENSKNYMLNLSIHKTLWNVQFIGDRDPVLNLSSRNIHALTMTVFNNVRDVESLDLSNNSLSIIYPYTFSNLTKLKRLSLANNYIRKTKMAFSGLKNLQLLDISYNPLKSFSKSTLFGVAKSTRILINTIGDDFLIFCTNMYTQSNVYMKRSRRWRHMHNLSANDAEEVTQYQFNKNKNNTNELGKISDMQSENEKINKTFDKNTRAKFCISNGIVRSFNILEENEDLAEGCLKANIVNDWIVFLTYFSIYREIAGFQKFWYRAFSLPIRSFRFMSIGIAEIQEEMLNNLPASVTEVYFDFNRIRKIRSNVIKNDNLRTFSFSNNLIEEIEDNAFAKTRLQELSLNANQLENLNFVFTLPDTIINLIVSRNRVTSIPNDAFSRFPNMSVLDLQLNKITMLPNNIFSRIPHLTYLSLEENQIETLPNNVFSTLSHLSTLSLQGNKIKMLPNNVLQNLTSLEMLLLGDNSIATFEPADFKSLKALTLLKLAGNSISDLHVNVFAKLTALKSLDLSRNKFIKVPAIQLPRTLDTLYLEYNEISALEKDSFVEVPRHELHLNGNPISSIARGAFDLPTLTELHIEKTNLTTMEGNSYEGLDGLMLLYLSENKISEIRKGSCKNLKSLEKMILTSNPLQKLESGAFYGLRIDDKTYIYFEKNNLKEIQAGLFEDI